MELTDIIKAPVITEKAQNQQEKFNKYAFIVDKRANKIQIKNAVEELYNVKVLDVNTVNYSGKARRRIINKGRNIIYGKTNAYKKAIVTLAPEDTIDFYSSI